MTEEHLNAPENTTPTTHLPNPDESPFFRGGPTPNLELPAEETPLEQPRLAVETQFKREQQREQDAAMASLDETILRPFVMPIDFGPGEEESRAAGQPPVPGVMEQGSPSATRFNWKPFAAAAVFAAIAIAVGVRAFGSRQSNVGLLGVRPPAEEASITAEVAPVEVTWPDEDEPVVNELVIDEPVVDNEPTIENTLEVEAPLYEEDTEQVNEPGAPQHTFTWDFSDPQEDEEYAAPQDEGNSVSLTFDGGNVTYYYDDDVMTMDWDMIDEIEQYLDLYDVWGYGTPGGEQGYGSGYGYGHERDRDPGYYYYGW